MKRNYLKSVVSAVVCGVVFAGCGDGSSKSGLSSNEFLGNLPALYADEALAEKADEEKLEKARESITSESGMKKYMELDKKLGAAKEARNAKLEENVKAEWEKINGKETPFSTSQAFNQTNIQVNWVKFDAEKRGMVASIVAKEDFVMNSKNMREYGYAWFRVLAKDGSEIGTDAFFLSAGGAEIVLRPKSYTADQSLHYEGGDAVGYLRTESYPEKFVDFAGIEFIIESER